jgi:allantoicase
METVKHVSEQDRKLTADTPVPAFVIAYSDSSFANPHRVVSPAEPVFDPNAFTYQGKEMDGIESKRHTAVRLNPDGQSDCFGFKPDFFNWFEIGLKRRTTVEKLAISTRWFTGNQVPKVSVFLKDEKTGAEREVLHRVDLPPDSEQQFDVTPPMVATEVRVLCYFDGGITRFHCFGEPAEPMAERENLLASATVSHVSNEHYGKPAQAISGNRLVGHMLGWESARTGFGEQALFQLAEAATIDEIVVDTYMHVYNSPMACHVYALHNTSGASNDELMKAAPRWQLCFAGGREVIPDNLPSYMKEEKYLEETQGKPEAFQFKLHVPKDSPWKPLLPFANLSRDTLHRFSRLEHSGPVTHILFMHFPNGGIHALRCHGILNSTK